MGKTRFCVGDLVRNRVKDENGTIVRIYADLVLPEVRKARKTKPVYVVAVPKGDYLRNREVLWREEEIEFVVPGS